MKTLKTEKSSEQEKIINYCTSKFLKDGFYLVTVDQIANELRISKKTIYKFFSTKDELVEAVAKHLMNDVSSKIDNIIGSGNDSLTKIIMLFEVMAGVVVRFSEKWLKDLQIHTPKLWQQIDEFRTKRAFTALGSIIRQGQIEGIIVEKPIELIIHIFVNTIRSVVHPDFLYYQKLDYREAFIHSFEILFNGILTPKGKSKFNKIFPKVIK
ncbi:MAG: TetR/AcrR family transcriptional regulator [Ignavibacterium album]|jgi:AcrR family transcriptional regulator|uniref:TetR/AcrR family transcriptional regulator n=1 Tax=Ignavibacterium album TaxID=591197 RepID=UPI0026EFC276|nr:TetR/AcrR family transcriptional regulator [Ignavibacterium album]MCX8105738.1 TetR/AcrR family transcriptional regulator [Ignavibacterium album]